MAWSWEELLIMQVVMFISGDQFLFSLRSLAERFLIFFEAIKEMLSKFRVEDIQFFG